MQWPGGYAPSPPSLLECLSHSICDVEEHMKSKLLSRIAGIHARLDRLVKDEQRSLNPDPFKLARLKKLKLSVKDALNRLSGEQRIYS